ncbi:MAG: hypothetical protein EHM61_10430 [Acidobacteria bacterium]|nr:MAG: hypothetical protein EHM61_10430 [Acidobacteriota bacterium]
MKLQMLVTLTGALLIGFGFVFLFWGPMTLSLFGASHLPTPVVSDEAAMQVWSAVAFTRLFGATLLGLGVVIWLLRSAVLLVGTRKLAGVIASIFGILSLTVLIQQLAVWRTSAGWAMLLVLLLLTFAYVCCTVTKTATASR